MTHWTRFFVMTVLVAAGVFSAAGEAAEPTLDWIRQFGTSEGDGAQGVSVDGLGKVYITGSTGGD